MIETGELSQRLRDMAERIETLRGYL
jgi:hypothetical protein